MPELQKSLRGGKVVLQFLMDLFATKQSLTVCFVPRNDAVCFGASSLFGRMVVRAPRNDGCGGFAILDRVGLRRWKTLIDSERLDGTASVFARSEGYFMDLVDFFGDEAIFDGLLRASR